MKDYDPRMWVKSADFDPKQLSSLFFLFLVEQEGVFQKTPTITTQYSTSNLEINKGLWLPPAYFDSKQLIYLFFFLLESANNAHNYH